MHFLSRIDGKYAHMAHGGNITELSWCMFRKQSRGSDINDLF